MRIIGGKYRGFKLTAPSNDSVRPTTDRIKEDIFNIISPHTPSSNFLDLFSGSGAIGLEAVSRGAETATLVEKNIRSLSLIKRNAAVLKGAENIYIVHSEAEKFLVETKDKYDIIFFDPPYVYPCAETLIQTISDRRLLEKGGVIIAEQGENSTLSENIGDFRLYKVKKYSSTVLYFYQYDIEGSE